MQRDRLDARMIAPTQAPPAPTARPKGKAINRPGTWFASSKHSSSSSSSSASSSATITGGSNVTAGAAPSPSPFPGSTFRSPFPSSKGKHKLSPSPSPRNEEDFVMISPVRPPQFHPTMPRLSPLAAHPSDNEMGSASGRSSSPIADSPTPACGMASATARLKLADDDSPIRRVPGQSRSLRGAIEDGGRSVFVSSEKMRGYPTSPLKHVNMYRPSTDEEDERDGSPRLASNALLGSGLPPQPLFPSLRTSQSQDCDVTTKSLFGRKPDEARIPRLSTSHPIRARTSLDADRPTLGSKKAISLDAIPTSHHDQDEPFGHPISNLGKKSRPISSAAHGDGTDSIRRAHKRINSGDHLSLAGTSSSISRSAGHKSGLALSLNLTPSPGIAGLPDLASNSSLSSLSTTGLTPPASAFSPAEPPIFEHVKPLAEAFEQPSTTVSRKFKPRDSGVSMGDEEKPVQRTLGPPPSVMKPSYGRTRRPAMLKRTSSMGAERADIETPSIDASMQSGWPGAPSTDLASSNSAFNFLGEGAMGISFHPTAGGKVFMPNTPVKKHAYGHSHGGGPFGHRVGHSMSQPTLASDSFGPLPPLQESTKPNIPPSSMMLPPPSTQKPAPSAIHVPHLMLTATSSPDSPSAMETDQSSPTVRIGHSNPGHDLAAAPPGRVGLLQRQSSGAGSSESEEEGTPTKNHGDRVPLGDRPDQKTPTPSPAKSNVATAASTSGIYPRLSLPAFAAPKQHRTLHHRQSHPAANVPDEEDVFEKRFITLETLGKGAFSTVVKVQDRQGDGLYAVKKARGVFDGVKDRLRHLEEVDILRHLSRNPCPHVIKFEDAWEQNRQLFIQTELCLGSLAFFLEEYGRVVERLDEGRVWKIVRELSDGINHIHSSGVIHFDIKPANILISSTGSLKIGDFGLATRWPRLSPAEIVHGSGLGGVVPQELKREKLEREGDRVYMPPEMLQGVFVMAADIFSFGLVILEVSTNICVPDGGAPWQALRSNDFSVVDLSPLSPALSDLIIQCMSADPASRPTIQHVVSHPIVQRARNGKDALAPEDPRWLVEVLTGMGGSSGFARGGDAGGDGDVVMEE